MFEKLKKSLGSRVIKNTFDSAFEHACMLPTAAQVKLANTVKQKTVSALSEDPFILEQNLNALNLQSRFMRQQLSQSGVATTQSSPEWLEAALLESFAMAGLSGDQELFSHVSGTLVGWIRRLAV